MTRQHGAIILTMTALALADVASSQDAYQLPFASSGNAIELTVANVTSTGLSGVRIAATNLPSWLKFSSAEQTLVLLKPGEEAVVRFSFSVDKSAPVNKEQKIVFMITSTSSHQWSKQIAVSVAPPDRMELLQNYPNPFNPSTTISYLLPSDGRVSLKIYNVLGQEIASLVDQDQAAGHHQAVLEASRFSTGMYVYRLSFVDQRGKRFSSQKRMILLK
jgi:hypothetical protein